MLREISYRGLKGYTEIETLWKIVTQFSVFYLLTVA